MTPTKALVDKFAAVYMPGGEIATHGHIIGRDEQIEMMGYADLARVHTQLLSEPGTAKSLLVDRRLLHIEGAQQFKILMGKDMTPDAILGPPDVMALKQGDYRRFIDNTLATAHFGFIDENYKCNSLTLNSLLGVINERELRNGQQVVKCPLISITGCSNELPGFDREDLQAFRDRLPVTMIVEPVRGKDERILVMKGQIARATNSGPQLTTITLDEFSQMHGEVDEVTVPEQVYEAMAKLVQMTEDATNGGYTPSMRRVGQAVKVMQARAWAHGRDEVSTDDIMVCQHIFWLDPDHKDQAYRNVLEFANAFARKAQQIRDAFEPTLQELDDLRRAFQDAGDEPGDENLNAAFRVMKHLRGFEKQAKEAKSEGAKQGHDTGELDKLLDEIKDAHGWVRRNLLGDEENE